jgi:hypothetical protein
MRAHGGATDLQAPGDLGFRDAGAMEFPDLSSVKPSGHRPAQRIAVLPGMGQTCANPVPQNVSLELSEGSQQACHSSTGWRGQIQRFGERYKTDSEMLQFLDCCQQVRYRPAPAIQPPDQHDVDLPASRCIEQLLPECSVGRRRNRFL